MAGLIEGIRNLFAAKQHTAAEAYADLVRRVATGKERNPESAAAILAAVNKSADDLERDVATLKDRQAKLSQLDQRDALAEEYREAMAAQLQAQAEHDELVRQSQERLRAIDVRVSSVRNKLNTLDNMKRELQSSAPPEMHDRRRALIAERMKSLQALAHARHLFEEARAIHVSLEAKTPTVKPENREHHEGELRRAEGNVAHYEGRVADLQSEVDRLDSELAAVKELMAAA